MKKITTPTTIVIFGATGDLTQRKLLPSLLDLYVKKLLPTHFEIVGFSRRPLSDQIFRKFAKQARDAWYTEILDASQR